MDGVSAGVGRGGRGVVRPQECSTIEGDQDAITFELQILRDWGAGEPRVRLRPEARGAQINHLTRKFRRSVAGVTFEYPTWRSAYGLWWPGRNCTGAHTSATRGAKAWLGGRHGCPLTFPPPECDLMAQAPLPVNPD